MTTTWSGTSANKPAGKFETFFIGMVTTMRSTPRTASGTETAVAPVSAARLESVSGPRELATETSCPNAVRRRVNVPPIWPAPIMPIFIALLRCTDKSTDTSTRRVGAGSTLQCVAALSSRFCGQRTNSLAGLHQARRPEASGDEQLLQSLIWLPRIGRKAKRDLATRFHDPPHLAQSSRGIRPCLHGVNRERLIKATRLRVLCAQSRASRSPTLKHRRDSL